MSESDDVSKIMENIKKQSQNNTSNSDVTPQNIISLASIKYHEKLSKLDSNDLKHVKKLDSIVSKEENNSNLDINDKDFGENLIQANLSYDIQTINKIETFKPKPFRKWVLKFRNLIQNEVRFAINPIVDKQIKFNIHITRSVNGLKKILDDVELKHQLRIDAVERIANVEVRKRIDAVELKHQLKIDNVNVEVRRKIDLLSVFNAYHNYLKRDPTSSELKQWLQYDYESDPLYEQLMTIKKSDEAKHILKNDLRVKGIIMNDDTVCYKKIDDQIIHFNLDDKNYLEPFSIDQLYEPGTTNFLKTILKKGMNVINIGANIGYFTLLAAREVGPDGKVFAFEPFPQTVELLKKNIDSNGYKNVEVISMAVSDRKEKSFLALKSDSGHNFVTSASNKEYDSIEISTITADDYFDENLKIDFLIMDAEGYEPKILDGMKNILENNLTMQILTEYNPHTLQIAKTSGQKFLEKLEEFGFSIQVIDIDGQPQNYIKDDILKIKFPNTATLFLTKP